MRYASIAPMNKTVYLREDEVPIWEKARELSGDKLSPVIVAALKRFIAEHEGANKAHSRIVVEFSDSSDFMLPKVKAFYGKWLVPPEEEFNLPLPKQDEWTDCAAVAETAKGSAVVFRWRLIEGLTERWMERFSVYQNLEHAAQSPDVNYVVLEAIKRRGVPVEELDI